MLTPRPRSGAAAMLLWGLIAVSLTGCAATSAYTSPGDFERSSSDLTLAVVNRNYEDVRLYLSRESSAIPIGTVRAFGSRSFKIPKNWVGCSNVLRLAVVTTISNTQVDLIPIDFEQGQTVEAWIGTFLQNSRLHAFPVPLE